MSEIKAGDLVIIVHSACGNEGRIGTALRPLGVCGVGGDRGDLNAADRWLVEFPNGLPDTFGDLWKEAGVRTAWLRKIDPLSEPESIEHEVAI